MPLVKIARVSGFHHTSSKKLLNLYIQKVKQLLSVVLNLSVPKLVKLIPASFQSIFTYFACKISRGNAEMGAYYTKLKKKKMFGWVRRRGNASVQLMMKWRALKADEMLLLFCQISEQVCTWAINTSAEMCKMQTCSKKWCTLKRRIGYKISLTWMWKQWRRTFLLCEILIFITGLLLSFFKEKYSLWFIHTFFFLLCTSINFYCSILYSLYKTQVIYQYTTYSKMKIFIKKNLLIFHLF